ncbi:UDP-3-O-(3-hydroxymyristoyl)glucosamine N-acyltransferase [Pseudothauera nasutitermitis]|uniref:UDP-3-O-acylglucosamine N-acyltransferase n=1 Tax=Pseudothauera nasutitermitis TaxID=2565930 RepID=A0A4S4B200_9RHOO|nr:UDP-3-O-(3-hydroxymyristoyl)glucosamine N-acyltransferase [Pseudothauera nasutitermitis]THF66215.1 UDP-3-O-(3-hydroxymyristoyl)glucosamine N-acyltransferase [Pseudothauera nasutitermitis]
MFRLDELVARLGGELIGDPAVRVGRIATLDTGGEGDLAFLANRKYASRLKDCRASAVILAPDARESTVLPRIVTADPYVYFARVAQLFNPPVLPPAGLHPGATVMADVPPSVSIAPGAVVEAGALIGEGAVIGPGCHVGRDAHIGAHSVLHANVSIYHGCRIGARCILHAGVVIGADGFGFARERDGRWVKIPQTGRVLVGDDVEIGANTTIDRGALDDTVIGEGAKLDNQIQIAHNVRIGAHTAIAGCVGIAGSTVIGARCMIGGQAGIIGHLSIADDVVVSAGTLVTKSIARAGVYTASLPVQSHPEWVRNFAHLRHLDAMADRIRALEQRLDKADPAE